MANILSNFEGWGPTEVAYKKKVYSIAAITRYLQSTHTIYILFIKYNFTT